ncbi:hypothetical protein K457DRAFT_135496 [Linnemannia elongata AG-77]|uniref:Uncharacterized protein n=1 Tax=Linnemannia elongata AG-77 TaxID=1314771 RepID=A0A197K632_9FUNG|nr:hypothetical protein K457DRAFT_135496 [Linnemannia elongata AG-77]
MNSTHTNKFTLTLVLCSLSLLLGYVPNYLLAALSPLVIITHHYPVPVFSYSYQCSSPLCVSNVPQHKLTNNPFWALLFVAAAAAAVEPNCLV